MDTVERLPSELVISVCNGEVWLTIAIALIVYLGCLLFGTWLSNDVGFLSENTPPGDRVGVGLAVGVLTLSSVFAAAVSGGRSSFTPAALAFVVGLIIVVAQRWQPTASHGARISALTPANAGASAIFRNGFFEAALLGAAFIVITALLYASTMAPSPRDGVQPVEFMDEAFYSVLGADLASTGTENLFSPAGFDDIPGLPEQTWYHWGELWMAAAVIKLFDVAPIMARHLVVLPILLLSAAALTGAVVRQLNQSASRQAYFLGFLGCVFLAPIPWLFTSHFTSWATGLVFGVSMYGFAAVLIPLVAYILASRDAPPTWKFAGIAGSTTALLLPAHIVIAALATSAAFALLALRLVRRLVLKQSIEGVPHKWRRTVAWATLCAILVLVWGLATGHGIGASGLSDRVPPFNSTWRDAVIAVVVGAGAFYSIAAGWYLVRRDRQGYADFLAVTALMLVASAVLWGVRLGDFNMFHFFFGGIAVFGTLAASTCMWAVWARTRASPNRRLALAVGLLFAAQLEIGAVIGIIRLQSFGPSRYAPVPVALLEAIRQLPGDAKIAYSCGPLEEISYWDARMLSISVHTGHRIIPLCFQSDVFGSMLGADRAPQISPHFLSAPQRGLFPDAVTRPTQQALASFFQHHVIHYIYVDDKHPNDLIPEARSVIRVGPFGLLEIP